MSDTLDRVSSVLADAVIDDAEAGVYRANRSIFTDDDIFELEMKYIFEGNWIYLAHESQLPNNNDYLTTYIGRQPIVISRDKDGELHALINACSHRGAMLCRRKKDNRTHVHLPVPRLDVQQQRQAAQGQGPARRRLPGAVQPERLARPDQGRAVRVLPRLPVRQPQPRRRPAGRAPRRRREIIDMIVDQSPEGLEVLRGVLHLHLRRQLEGPGRERRRRLPRDRHALELRGHHGAAHHRRVGHRDQGHGRRQWGKSGGGYYVGPTATCCSGTWAGNPEDRPLWDRRDELKAKFGQAKGDWMLKYSRNLCLYPNVYIMDQFCSQIRHFRPIAVDKTEVTIYCIAPKGESAEARAAPDPAVRGLLQRQRHGHPGRPRGVPLLPEDLPGHRGAVERHEPRRRALDRRAGRRLPRSSACDRVISTGVKTEDEGLYPVQHGYWLKTMRAAVAAEAASTHMGAIR